MNSSENNAQFKTVDARVTVNVEKIGCISLLTNKSPWYALESVSFTQKEQPDSKEDLAEVETDLWGHSTQEAQINQRGAASLLTCHSCATTMQKFSKCMEKGKWTHKACEKKIVIEL